MTAHGADGRYGSFTGRTAKLRRTAASIFSLRPDPIHCGHSTSPTPGGRYRSYCADIRLCIKATLAPLGEPTSPPRLMVIDLDTLIAWLDLWDDGILWGSCLHPKKESKRSRARISIRPDRSRTVAGEGSRSDLATKTSDSPLHPNLAFAIPPIPLILRAPPAAESPRRTCDPAMEQAGGQ